MSALAELVGRNVKKLREEQDLTQDDLQRVLGDEWTRASVGMLESKGVRGDRVYWFATLCRALNVSASELLKPDESTADPRLLEFAAWGPAAFLRGGGKGKGRRAYVSYSLNLGEDNAEESKRIARQFDIPEDELRDAISSMTGQPSPTAFRDYLAYLNGLNESATRSEARSQRGHATRLLRSYVEEFRRAMESPLTKDQVDAFLAWREERLAADGLD